MPRLFSSLQIEQEISVTRTANVPKGNYCVRCGDDVENIEKCEQLRHSVSKVGWDDGLGSPGYIDFYRCALFDTGLYIQRLYGLIINKCTECVNKQGE